MTTRRIREIGWGRIAVMALAVMVIVFGLFYLAGRPDLDVAEVGENVTTDLGRAASTLRETSEDALTTAKVKTALAVSRTVSASDIDVDARRGTVTLNGAVPSADVEAAALAIARDTSGVVEVVDRLAIGAGPTPCTDTEDLENRLADAELKALVYEALLRAEPSKAEGIDVLVQDRVVTLAGTTTDELAAKRTAEIAGSVQGVKSVRSDLNVTRPAAVPKPDEIIVVDVREALESSGAIVLDTVEIEVHSGLVQLRGVVRSEAEKQLAEMLAGSEEGVVEVMNGLKVS